MFDRRRRRFITLLGGTVGRLQRAHSSPRARDRVPGSSSPLSTRSIE
jgi:hypothetical protein